MTSLSRLLPGLKKSTLIFLEAEIVPYPSMMGNALSLLCTQMAPSDWTIYLYCIPLATECNLAGK